MAFKFPFTNYHELNLTWILDQLKSLFEKSEENVTVIENYDGRLTAVETELPSVADTAQDAAQTAAAAASLAQTAKATADTAQENAIQAQSAAGTARQEAQDAQTAAASAIQAAQQAQATAQNFDGRITQAENDASEALEASHSFENRVQAAINTANNAASTATNAQGIATNANQNAAAALDKVGNLNDLKTSAKNNLVTALNEVSDKSVKDVQINGQSIVASGIASIPLASSSRLGVIRPLQNGGVTIDAQGRISTVRASLDSIKTAIANYPVIVPSNQYAAVFYGLATAAGDSSQAGSSNKVGTYTEQAKAAILAMLGVTDQLNAKQNAPTAAGAAGQVLGLDSSLNPVWINQSGGGGDVSNCAPIIINTASGDIASFADGADNRQIRKIVATIEPVQAGSGDPSPTNVRTISGWTGCTIVNSPTTDAQDGTTYPITFPTEAGTVYGGTLDVTSGLLTVTRGYVDLGTLTWIYDAQYTRLYANLPSMAYKPVRTAPFVCSQYQCINDGRGLENVPDNSIYNGDMNIYVHDSAYTDATTFKAAMSGVQLVYELAFPIKITLTPTEVTTLLGTNNIWADTGDVTVEYPADTKLYIDGKIAALDT